MRRIISDLIRYSEEHLKLINFRSNRAVQNTAVLNELRKRNLTDQFRIRSGSILSKLNSIENVDSELLMELRLPQ